MARGDPMRHLRADYDAIQPWPTKRPHIVKVDGKTRSHDGIQDWEAPDSIDPIIPDDEPVFVLRAMDALAPAVLHLWARSLWEHSGDQPLVDRVHKWADEMEDYARSHGGSKVPDTPASVLR